MKINNQPIGIFDSGIGGLTVLKEVKKLLPKEDYIYIADLANNPFGDKSKQEILSINDQIFNYFISQGVKLVIIACNTSSSLALEHDQINYDINIIDMLNDGLWFASELEQESRVGVLATTATVNSNAYIKHLKKLNSNIEVKQKACPKLVPIIEEFILNNDFESNSALYFTVKEYISKLTDSTHFLMGCSHYPYIMPIIKNLNSAVTLLDPSYYVAQKIKDKLENIGVNPGSGKVDVLYTAERKGFIRNLQLMGYNYHRLVSLK